LGFCLRLNAPRDIPSHLLHLVAQGGLLGGFRLAALADFRLNGRFFALAFRFETQGFKPVGSLVRAFASRETAFPTRYHVLLGAADRGRLAFCHFSSPLAQIG
jgi:hypothetical protein